MQKKRDHLGFLSSLFAIFVGLLVGMVILLVSNPAQAFQGFFTILTGPVTHGLKGVGQVFYYATPIIMTGLSVGFAFKTGLFNIGAAGQFIIGAFAAVVVGIHGKALGSAQWIVALLAATIAGFLWGAIPGIFKACFNVNEVIACIMTNYIGMYLVNYLVSTNASLYDKIRNYSKDVAKTANIPGMGLDKLFEGSSINGGFLIALIAVAIIYVVLQKTTFGYELKAAGFNKDASKYAGMNEKRNIIVSMAIAGALSGLGGAMLYLAGSGKHIVIQDVLAAEGMNGISVALLGLSHPIGVLFAGLFIAYITAGGFYLQLLDFPTEIIDIITAVIIYFSAFSLFVRVFLLNLQKKRELTQKANEKTKEGGTAE
ncbi:MAG: ABC transporter permease [Lachnospiraceae bacterium]|nr:ABC transporter permease [Lachnospiraceae bacterium]